MRLDCRIFMVLFHIIVPKLIHSQTSETSSSETKIDSAKDARKQGVVLNKCCENEELFEIVSNKCIQLKEELPSPTFSHEKKLTLGEYSKILI